VNESVRPAPDSHVVTILTTEHFTLQTARGGTIGEANGRASIYLGAVSSGMIALGFVAEDTDRFALFAASVLPAVLLLGWFTFARLVQTGVESLRYLVRIQRIRRWYADVVPPGSPWFADLPAGTGEPDEAADAVRSMGMQPSFRQMFYTAASMVGALNSLVLGVAVTLAVGGAELVALTWATILGVAVALLALVAHVLYERREFGRSVV
jgi:hypothetical protein